MFRILFAYMTRINNFSFAVNLTCCNFAIRVSCFSIEFVISINLVELSSKDKIEYLSYKKMNYILMSHVFLL